MKTASRTPNNPPSFDLFVRVSCIIFFTDPAIFLKPFYDDAIALTPEEEEYILE